MTFYVFWAAIATSGVVLMLLDQRWIGRPLFGALLVAGICGGLVTTQVSPFNFYDGGYALEGLLVTIGSALALIGYGVGAIWRSFVSRSDRQRSL